MKTQSNILKITFLFFSLLLFSCLKKNIPPTVLNQTFSINENAPTATIIGKVIASDEDGEIVSYTIKDGNSIDAFSINETDGTITVNDQTQLDYEVNPRFNLIVAVKDNKGKSSMANITITLNDIDETPRAVSISTNIIKYGSILTIYGKYINKDPGSTIVSLQNNSIIHNLTPLFIGGDSIKVMVYNEQDPNEVLDLSIYKIGITTLGTTAWSDLYFSVVTNWIRVTDFPGTARYKSTAFSLGNNVYLGGGAANGLVFNDFWSYNPQNNKWTKLNDIPGTARVYPGSSSSSLFGYIGGGYTTENYSKVQLYDFYKYDPQTYLWTAIPNYPDNILNYYVGYSVTVNGRPFLSLSNQILYIQELTNDQWSSHPSVAEMIDCPAAGVFAIGNSFYVVAGYRINNTISNAVWEYNVNSGVWTKKSNFPGIARFGGAAFSVGNFGYYGCGMSVDLQQYKDIWRYDPAKDTWIKFEDFPGGYRSHTISASDGNYGFIGLGYRSSSTYFSDFWKFNPR